MTDTHTHSFLLDGPLRVAGPAVDGSPLDLILPGSDGYEVARLPWNLAADQRPAAICHARSVADVQAALAYARDHGLTVAAQTTGHLAQTLPSLGRTLLLKTCLHAGAVEVDPVARTARILAGATWGDVVDAVAPHGLAVMHGSSPSVGVIGYLLGGGLSFYGRRHGLAANHVRALDVVTPDGVLRRADAEHHRELFYALRGGAGGYGVVVAVELGLLPYAEVTAGSLFFGAEHARAVLRAWRNWTASASEGITTTFRILCLPPLPEVPEPLRAVPTVCVNGVALDPGEAACLESHLGSRRRRSSGGFGLMPSAAIVRLHGDPEDPVPGVGDGLLLEKLDDWAIETFVRTAGPGSPLLAAELRHLGGALGSPRPGPGHAATWRVGTCCSASESRAPRRQSVSSTRSSTTTWLRWRRGRPAHGSRASPSARTHCGPASRTRRSRGWPGPGPRSTRTACSSPPICRPTDHNH